MVRLVDGRERFGPELAGGLDQRVAHALLAAALPLIERKGSTLIGVSLSNLEDTDEQLVFSFDRKTALDRVLDRVRERYGSAAITRGVLVGRDEGLVVPLLPD